MKHIKQSSNRIGDLSEYYAVTWLWDEGYEVFTNAGSDGLIDMIAWNPNTQETIFIDVKTSRNSKHKKNDMSGGRTAAQIKGGVRLLSYNADTRKLSFVEHRNEQSD